MIIIISHHSLVNMVIHNKDSCPFQVQINENIDERIVARGMVGLSVKKVCGWHIGIGKVFGIIGYLGAYLGI